MGHSTTTWTNFDPILTQFLTNYPLRVDNCEYSTYNLPFDLVTKCGICTNHRTYLFLSPQLLNDPPKSLQLIPERERAIILLLLLFLRLQSLYKSYPRTGENSALCMHCTLSVFSKKNLTWNCHQDLATVSIQSDSLTWGDGSNLNNFS